MRLPAACQDLEMIIGSPHPQVRSGGRGGVEPPTFRFSGGRSYQLSYLTEPVLLQPSEPVPKLKRS